MKRYDQDLLYEEEQLYRFEWIQHNMNLFVNNLWILFKIYKQRGVWYCLSAVFTDQKLAIQEDFKNSRKSWGCEEINSNYILSSVIEIDYFKWPILYIIEKIRYHPNASIGTIHLVYTIIIVKLFLVCMSLNSGKNLGLPWFFNVLKVKSNEIF